MQRVSSSAALALVSGILLAGWVPPAQADAIGGMIVIPGSGNDLVAIPLVVATLTLVAVAVANPMRKRRFS